MNAVIFEQTIRPESDSASEVREDETTVDGYHGEVLGTAGTIDDILGKEELPKKSSGTGKRGKRKLTSTNVALLRKRMDKAVREEDYEEAARIRDRIRELEHKE